MFTDDDEESFNQLKNDLQEEHVTEVYLLYTQIYINDKIDIVYSYAHSLISPLIVFR